MNQDLMIVSFPSEHIIAVSNILRSFGIKITQIEEIGKVRAGLVSHSPAFLLLDIELEGANELLREASKSMCYPPPYIVAAGKFSNLSECIAILDFGADVCINKPICAEEVLTVINAVLRRERKIARLHVGRLLPQIDYKDLSIAPLRRMVKMRGERVELTEKEFDILYLLAYHSGNVLTREQIYESVWKKTCFSGAANVSGHVFSLRQKLGLDPKDKDYVQTVFGVGYRFVRRE